jgi:hypothetical protein
LSDNSVFYYFLVDLPSFLCLYYHRNLVSASQDGKLIVWDSYTTNKVRHMKVGEISQPKCCPTKIIGYMASGLYSTSMFICEFIGDS